LLERLKTELPGIAARCVAAYHRARDRGRLIQPRSSERLEAEIVKSSDPFTLFMQETFIADPTGTVLCSRAFFAFRNWCDRRGRQELLGGPDGRAKSPLTISEMCTRSSSPRHPRPIRCPMIEPPAGLTHLGRCGLPPVRLVVENTRSYEWQSYPRRDPLPARNRLAPLRPWRYIPRKEDRR
jgi:hypothetical protein